MSNLGPLLERKVCDLGLSKIMVHLKSLTVNRLIDLHNHVLFRSQSGKSKQASLLSMPFYGKVWLLGDLCLSHHCTIDLNWCRNPITQTRK